MRHDEDRHSARARQSSRAKSHSRLDTWGKKGESHAVRGRHQPMDKRKSRKRSRSRTRYPSYPDEASSRMHGGESKRSRRTRSRDVRSQSSPKENSDSESIQLETEEERRLRWEAEWERVKWNEPPRPHFPRVSRSSSSRGILQLEYWERTPDNAARKQTHMDQLDRVANMSREEWILTTTLKDVHVAIEPNLFPYETPNGVSHYTLWSRTYLYHDEVEGFVESWLDEHRPSVKAWAWDPSNLSEGMSVDLYHVHVFFWEPVRRTATIKVSRSRSHRAQLPLPDPEPEQDKKDRWRRSASNHRSTN